MNDSIVETNNACDAVVKSHPAKEGISYIEVLENGDEIWIGANPAGLIRMAEFLVRLAQGEVEGAHIHLDETSIVDKSEKALILRRIIAPWESSTPVSE